MMRSRAILVGVVVCTTVIICGLVGVAGLLMPMATWAAPPASPTPVGPSRAFTPGDVVGHWRRQLWSYPGSPLVELWVSGDGEFRETVATTGGHWSVNGRWRLDGDMIDFTQLLEFDGRTFHTRPTGGPFLLYLGTGGCTIRGGIYIDPDNYEPFDRLSAATQP